MATERDVECNQIFLDACVLLDGPSLITVLIVTRPLLQPRSLDIAKRRTSVGRFLFLCCDIAQEPSSDSAQIAESYGTLPKQRVEVTGTCLSINLNFLDVSIIFNPCLVLHAVNVPIVKKYRFLKRNLFVTVSNPEKTAKTTDVSVEGQMAKWNQSLDSL
jgi:hypothetical protein